MSDTNIDNKSFNFLKHLYECNECSVEELAHFLGIKDISGIPELASIALPLFESKHIVVKHPKLTYADSISLEAYKFACERNSVRLFTPDCVIGILPKGRVFVEEKIQKQEEFEKQFNALQTIATASLEQSESAKQYAQASQEHAKSAKISAELAVKQVAKSENASHNANLKSNISLACSIISVIGVLLSNADKIVHNVQSILSYLSTLIR